MRWKLQRCISAAELETTTLLGVYRSSLRVCVQWCSSCNALHTCSCVHTCDPACVLAALHAHALSCMRVCGRTILACKCAALHVHLHLSSTLPLLHVHEPSLCSVADLDLTYVLGSTRAHRTMLEREYERDRETERARHSARAWWEVMKYSPQCTT